MFCAERFGDPSAAGVFVGNKLVVVPEQELIDSAVGGHVRRYAAVVDRNLRGLVIVIRAAGSTAEFQAGD